MPHRYFRAAGRQRFSSYNKPSVYDFSGIETETVFKGTKNNAEPTELFPDQSALFSLKVTDSSQNDTITAPEGYSATSDDDNKFSFSKFALPGGTGGELTFVPAVDGTVTFYVTNSDASITNTSKFSNTSTDRGLNVKAGEADAKTVISGEWANNVAYHYTMNVTADTTYVLTPAKQRLVLFGLAFSAK